MKSSRLKSPGWVLLNKYIKPSKESIGDWKHRMHPLKTNLSKIISGEYCFSLKFCIWLAKETQTSPQYWLHLQNAYKLECYSRSRDEKEAIPRIWNKLDPVKPGHALVSGLMLKLNLTSPVLGRAMNLATSSVNQIISRSKRINFEIAGKLGVVSGWGAKYWLDIQTRQDVLKELNVSLELMNAQYPSLNNYFKLNLQKKAIVTKNSSHSNKSAYHHPGKILLMKYFKRSGISLLDWSYFFDLSSRRLKRIVTAKSELSIGLIFRISKIFATKPEYWIELQNTFYARKCTREIRKRLSLGRLTAIKKKEMKRDLIGKRLLEKFLEPMNWSLFEFADHLKMARPLIVHLVAGRQRVNFEVAIRLAESLGTDPMFWLNLQVEQDIAKAKDRR
jgi:addiction module HigA family antidote